MSSSGRRREGWRRRDVPLLDKMMYPYPTFSGRRDAMFIEASRERVDVPGWLGHLIGDEDEKQEKEAGGGDSPNCLVLPIPGAAPLMCVVATSDIQRGDRLRGGRSDSGAAEDLCGEMDRRYCMEFAELRCYLDMAYEQQPTGTDGAAADAEFVHPFHSINAEYPGLRMLHSNPDVYAIDNFLTDEECDRIIEKASAHLKPCLVKNAETGAVEEDPKRTSTNANVPRAEVPTVVSKILDATGCDDERQLEIMQVLRYDKEQRFSPHTDGFSGPITACGFQQSGRLVTCFCYLNDVEEGGETSFTRIGLDVRPRKGMAVLHFPNTLGLEEDLRTEHEGSVAVDTKWLLATWCWKNYRSDVQYSEEVIPRLDGDII